MTRLFLDTNIVVDLLDRREPFCHAVLHRPQCQGRLHHHP